MLRAIIVKKTTFLTTATVLVLSQAGCASMQGTQAEEGAAIGATSGAVVGAIIGRASGSTAKGAILGAVLGGAAGAAIGSQMDEQAEDLMADLDNAEIERVGEGIQITFDSGILFGFDSDELKNDARSNLADLKASLEQYEGTDVLIVGHTDSTGSDDYNQNLSERRARSAARYLVEQGLTWDRIATEGLGETEPVADNATADGRTQNRRVEVAIFASEEMQKQMRARHGG